MVLLVYIWTIFLGPIFYGHLIILIQKKLGSTLGIPHRFRGKKKQSRFSKTYQNEAPCHRFSKQIPEAKAWVYWSYLTSWKEPRLQSCVPLSFQFVEELWCNTLVNAWPVVEVLAGAVLLPTSVALDSLDAFLCTAHKLNKERCFARWTPRLGLSMLVVV